MDHVLELRDVIAALQWQIEIGADEAVFDQDLSAETIISEPPPGIQPSPPARAAAPSLPLPLSSAPASPLGSPAATATARAAAEGASTLEELKAAMGAFEGLTLKHTATNLVFARGNPQAPLMLLGEAPGAEEDRRGLPFVGASGQLLDRMLAAIGLTEDQFYVTNVLTWRPPGNRKPTPAEITICLAFAERHIALVRPQVVVLLGDTAAKALLGGNEGITRTRGRWFHLSNAWLQQPIDTLATFHPAYLLRTPASKRESWRDLLMVKAKLAELNPSKFKA